MIDPDGRIFWVVAGAAVGAYLGASMTNDWQFDPGKWAWNKGKTYAGLVIGAVVGGYTGANLAYAYDTTGIDFTFNGIELGTLAKGGAAAGGSAVFGYLAYNEVNGSLGSSGNRLSENNSTPFERNFLAKAEVDVWGITGEYYYEGVPISILEHSSLGQFHLLPDGSLFRDPVYGGILNVNAEHWIHGAGGTDPGLLDPIDWLAGYGAAKSLGYSANFWASKNGFGVHNWHYGVGRAYKLHRPWQWPYGKGFLQR